MQFDIVVLAIFYVDVRVAVKFPDDVDYVDNKYSMTDSTEFHNFNA